MKSISHIVVTGSSLLFTGSFILICLILFACRPEKNSSLDEDSLVAEGTLDNSILENQESEKNTKGSETASIQSQEKEAEPIINKRLEGYARRFTFAQRQIVMPKHSNMGVLLRPSQLFDVERKIYSQFSNVYFWNDFNFEKFGLDPSPRPPFRSVLIGEISVLGFNRYEILLGLEGFDAEYFFDIVLEYNEEGSTIVLIRYFASNEVSNSK